jgi:hypothetical protein
VASVTLVVTEDGTVVAVRADEHGCVRADWQ